MVKTFFVAVLIETAFLSSVLWAENEVQDAYTGTNVRREVTETNSLFNVLRNIYRPNYNKRPQTATQAPYQQIAPPKWSYYGTRPEGKSEPQTKSPAVDGRYYKPPAKPETKKK